MSEQPYRIPTSVTRDQMLEASKPLLDLLGLDLNEVYNLHIGGEWITTTIAARTAGEQAERPSVPTAGAGVEQPQEYAIELAHFITVQVVD